MGRKTQRKRLFLSQNPICCFCGGKTQAAEPDHIPSRVLFYNRQWPEGYEFPACVLCNRQTRHDEQVVAMLSRMYPDATTPEEKKEVEERILAVASHYPDIINEIQPTIRQKRNAAKKYNIEIPEGGSSEDAPILYMHGPLVNKAVTNFGRKLFLALYYKHTGEILSKEAGIALLWFSNLQIADGTLPKEIAPLVNNFPRLVRCNTELHDQFNYRYGFSDCGTQAVFVAFFRQSFAILGYINKNASDFKLPEGAIILGPFDHSSRP